MLKRRIYQFTCHFIPDENGKGFSVEVPALPGCVSEGDTHESAKANIAKAIELYCETLIERGLSIPADKDVHYFKAKVKVPLCTKGV